jgi:hypothetical protein
VQADSLSQAADDLYGLVPAQFTAARDEQARQARSAGQRDTAAEIKKLPRPTAGAWLVNQLVRGAPAQMDQLFEIGQLLQEAQRELDGERMRELSVRRRQIINELVPEAARLAAAADLPASAAVLGEVRATLEAALADPAAGEAVKSGRLARALTYAGLGEVDLTAALAGPSPTGRAAQERRAPTRAGAPAAGRAPATTTATTTGGASTGPSASQQSASQQSASQRSARPRGREAVDDDADAKAALAREAVSEAEAALQTAGAAAAEAEAKVASLVEQRQFLRRRIEHLKGELDQASSQSAQLARDGKQAQRDLEIAAKRLAAAQRQLAKARERAGSG